MQTVAHIALVVRDYDEVIAWFTRAPGSELVANNDMGGGKRWGLLQRRGP
jgi:catechol 2,3-dioxygenase-like lactoylglutathione lyase family enzyme